MLKFFTIEEEIMAELNGKYINEENHQRVKKGIQKIGTGLIIAGAICMAVGLALVITGIVLIAKNAQVHGSPVLGILAFLFPGLIIGAAAGIPMLATGINAKIASHAREIAAFGASSVLPVAGESMNYISDEIAPAIGKGLSNLGKGLGDAASAITGGIAGGIAGGVRNSKKDLVCPGCGEKNVNNAKFCAKCGHKFADKAESKKSFCPNCGDENEVGQKFCEKCGHKLDQ